MESGGSLGDFDTCCQGIVRCHRHLHQPLGIFQASNVDNCYCIDILEGAPSHYPHIVSVTVSSFIKMKIKEHSIREERATELKHKCKNLSYLECLIEPINKSKPLACLAHKLLCKRVHNTDKMVKSTSHKTKEQIHHLDTQS